MANKIDVLVFLVNDTKEKQEELDKYNEERSKISYKDEHYYQKMVALGEKFPSVPTKAMIKDNLKIIRRIANEIMKEV